MSPGVFWLAVAVIAGLTPLILMVFSAVRMKKTRERREAELKRQQVEWEAEFARRQEAARQAAKPRVAIDSRRVSAGPIVSARRVPAPAPSPRRTSSPAPAAAPASDDWVIPASLAFTNSRDDSPAPAPASSFSSGGGGDYSGGGASGSWGDSSSSSSSSSSCSSSDSGSSSSSSSSGSSD